MLRIDWVENMVKKQKKKLKGHYSVKIEGRKRKTPFKGSREKVYEKLHKKGYIYNKHTKEWEKKGFIEVVEVKPNLDQIKQKMIDEFEKRAQYTKDHKGIKGYDNMHFKSSLDTELESQDLNDEGDGWYQLASGEISTKNGKLPPIKIRYNPNQQELKVYIRQYEVK